MSIRTQFKQIYLRDTAYLIKLQKEHSGRPIKKNCPIYIFKTSFFLFFF